jgi:hypothetical protein
MIALIVSMQDHDKSSINVCMYSRSHKRYLERQPSTLQTFKLRCCVFDLQPRHYVVHIARPGAAAANTTGTYPERHARAPGHRTRRCQGVQMQVIHGVERGAVEAQCEVARRMSRGSFPPHDVQCNLAETAHHFEIALVQSIWCLRPRAVTDAVSVLAEESGKRMRSHMGKVSTWNHNSC